LRNLVNAENVHRACKIRGLSWSTKPEEVVEFFQAFNITEKDVVIEQEDGKNTGFALVFLKDEEEVEKAKTELDHQYIGKRWIGFCEIRLRG
jgi:RNA recognition motif-containing protein